MLMSKEQKKETIQEFKNELVGWTIVDILPPTKDETIMKIVVEYNSPLNNRTKTITIGATDLGFWMEK